nr:MAG TPA: hypothetical protein [Caudoviricetes sp.]
MPMEPMNSSRMRLIPTASMLSLQQIQCPRVLFVQRVIVRFFQHADLIDLRRCNASAARAAASTHGNVKGNVDRIAVLEFKFNAAHHNTAFESACATSICLISEPITSPLLNFTRTCIWQSFGSRKVSCWVRGNRNFPSSYPISPG